MTDNQKLKDRVAIVTGADSGIGQGIAIAFAKAGADVVITYRSDENGAKETAKHVNETGRKALVVQTDVADETQIKKLFDKTLSEFKRLDILVNNAGKL
jgi:glucose 1-dehydrogenase